MRIRLVGLALAAPLVALTPGAAAQAPPAKPPKTVGEVVVTGQGAAVQTGLDRRSYSVAGDLQAQTGSVADALRNVPQVQVDVQGNVSLRGDPNVTILVDGKPSSLFQGDNRAQALQSLAADQIERVEVITNPSAEFRAEGSAGIINLISKRARGTGRTGSLRLTAGDGDRFAAGASGGYNSKRLSVSGDLNARQDAQKSRSEDARLRRDPATGALQAIEQDQTTRLLANSFGARGSVDYDLTPRTRVGAEAHGNYSFFRVDAPSLFVQSPASFTRQLSVHQKRASGEASVNLRRKLAGDAELTASLSREQIVDPRVRAGHTFDRAPAAAEAFDEQRLDYHLHKTELKADLVQPLGDMAKLKLGVDVERDDNAYRNRGLVGAAAGALSPDPTLTNLFEFHQTVSAAYATYERPVGDLTVLAGLRIEDVRLRLVQATLGQVDEPGYLRAYPTLHLGWTLGEGEQLTASASRRVQRPDPREFNAFRFLVDPLNFAAGNPRLKPQQTDSFELGYERRSGPTLLLATLYYRQNRDGTADVLRDLGGGVFLTERANLARSRSAGLELVANGRLGKTLSYTLNGALSWTELESLGAAFGPTRRAVSGQGRGGLTWQASAADLFQLNAFVNGERLTPQGRVEPSYGLDLGYRRKLSDRLALVMTAQDLANSFRLTQVVDTPTLKARTRTTFDTRQLRVGLAWTLGGGRQRDPGFEFQTGAALPQ